MSVLDDLRDASVIATLRAPSTEAALGAVEALLAGGLRAVEVTYTTPNVPEVLRALKERHGDDVLLGAGTLLDPHQAAEAAEAGAEYLVSPGLDERVVRGRRDRGGRGRRAVPRHRPGVRRLRRRPRARRALLGRPRRLPRGGLTACCSTG